MGLLLRLQARKIFDKVADFALGEDLPHRGCGGNDVSAVLDVAAFDLPRFPVGFPEGDLATFFSGKDATEGFGDDLGKDEDGGERTIDVIEKLFPGGAIGRAGLPLRREVGPSHAQQNRFEDRAQEREDQRDEEINDKQDGIHGREGRGDGRKRKEKIEGLGRG